MSVGHRKDLTERQPIAQSDAQADFLVVQLVDEMDQAQGDGLIVDPLEIFDV